ncbi:MAG: hypothetical protein KKA73_04450 [Chloroflexi bacterium]|nr:hypothetical protein [Chloroflexota bacterium]MBU1746917.1 hypothetical protein [Chloroflexota bacterium]MBU1878227.1 hypothetical protein [Chloroflexota bacterium]
MSTAGRPTGVCCPIDLFSTQEAEVARLTAAINQAPKQPHPGAAAAAQELIAAVDVLLACEQYDKHSPDCRLCYQFSELRRQTASLVVKAGRLPRS